MATKRERPVANARGDTVSNELLRAFFDQSPDIIFIIDEKGRYVEVNPHGCEILGYTRKEMLSRSISDIVPTEDLERDPVAFDSMQRGKTVFRRRRMRRKDGKIVHAELTTRMLSSGNFIGIARDLTEHTLIEQSLQERDAQLASIFRAAPVGIGMVVNRVIQEANESLCRMTGYSREELIDQSSRMLYPGDEDFEFVGTEKYRQIGDRGTGTVETRWKRKDGAILDIILSSTPLHPEDLSRGVTFVALDITSRKHAEDSLREKEAELDRYFTNALDLLCIADTDGCFRRLNKEWEATLGHPIKELEGRRFLDFVHPDDLEATVQALAQLGEQKPVLNFTNRYRRSDGSYRWIEWRSFPSGKLIYAAARDITAQKESEETLRYERQLLRTLIDNIPDLIYAKDLKGRKTLANIADVRAMGARSEAEVLGKDDFAFYPKELAEGFFSEDQTVLRTGQPVINKEEYVLDEHGERRVILTIKQPLRDNEGKIIGLAGVGRDISDRKRTEQALRESEERLRRTLDATNVVVWEGGLDGSFHEIGPVDRLFGKPKGLFHDTLADLSESIHPEDRERAAGNIQQALRGEKEYHIEYRVPHSDESIHWIEAQGTLLRDEEGKPRRLLGIARDVTARKEAEDVLTENMRRLQTVVTGAPIVLYSFDRNGVFTLSEGKGLVGLGIKPGEIVGRTIFEVYGDQPAAIAALRRALAGETFTVELSFPGGATFEVSHTAMHDNAGDYAGTIGVLVDITDRKRAEEVVRNSEANLQLAFEAARLGDWMWNIVSGEVIWSARCKALYGLSPDTEITYERFLARVHPEDRERVDLALRQAVETRGEYEVEKRVIWPDGSMHWNSSRGRVLCDAAGQPVRLVGVTLEITDRKRAEEALRKSEEKYLKAFNSSPDSITLSDIDTGELLEVNTGFERVFGHKRDDVLGKSTRDLGIYVDLADRNRMIELLKRDGKVQNLELEGRRKSGERFQGLLSVETMGLWGKRLMITTVRDITDRKNAEIALRESEERFRLFMDHFPGLAYMKDSAGHILFANEGFRALMGVAPEEIIRRTNAEVFSAEFADKITADDKAVVETGENTQTEEHLRDRIWSTYKFILPRVGGPPLLGGFTLDITERKRAEQALQESEAKFRAAFENAPMGMSMIKPDGTYIDVNPALCRMFGYSKEELLGGTINKVTHPDDVESGNRWIRKMISGDRSEPEFEKRYIHRDGHIVWGLVRAEWINDESGKANMSVVHVLDITERKRAEKAIKESEANLNALINNRNESIWSIDGAYRLIIFNRFFEEAYLAAYGIQLAKGMNVIDTLSPDLKEIWKSRYDAALSGKRTVFEFSADFAGGLHHFEVSLNPIVSEGLVKGVSAISVDTTERRVAEEQIRRLNTELESRVKERTLQLEAANKELEAFAYSVSHDLRAPLRAIDGYSRILLEDYQSSLDTEGRRVCNVVRTETQRMGQLVDDLLAFSRLSRSHTEAITIRMAALVDSVLNETISSESRSRIEFSVETMPDATGDKNLIRQVWTNLLSNAVKFSSKHPRPRIEIRGRRIGNEIEYSVRDNGAGFDMKYESKLFGVFQRLHSSREFEGTGVGLAIVQRIVHRHGGRVWAEGETDRGATFFFTLPVKGA
jgi:PAS domain S-box-containing protein